MSAVTGLLGPRAVEVLFGTFLHALWEGALVGAVAALGLGLLARSSPRVRYGWAYAMLALLVLLPAVTAARLAASRPVAPAAATAPPLAATGQAGTEGEGRGVAASASPGSEPDRVPLAERAAPWVVTVWIAGALALLARHLGGWLLFRRRVLGAAVPADRRWVDALGRLADRLGVRRAVRLLVSSRIAVPGVIGWLRPVVVVPAAMLSGLAPATVEAILAHELAHVRRHDWLVNLLQVVAESALFFHPAAWWLSSRIRDEREHCCDDLAAGVAGGRREIARALAALGGVAPTGPALAASGGSLVARVRRLAGVEPVDPHASARAGAALALAAGLAIAIGGWSPAVHASGGSPLAERWARALAEIDASGGWVGWGLAEPAAGSPVISNTPDGPPDRNDAPPTRRALPGAGGDATVAILFGFEPGDPGRGSVRHVRLRDLDQPLDLGGAPVRWLGAADESESVALLERLRAASPDAPVRKEIAAALTLHGDGRLAVPAVGRVLALDPSPEVRGEALQWLDRHSGPAARAVILAALDDPAATVRREALGALAESGDPSARETLRRIAREHPDPELRSQALESLSEEEE